MTAINKRLTTQKPFNPLRIIVNKDAQIELDEDQNANIICNMAAAGSKQAYNSRIISTTSWFKGNRAQRERFPSNIRPNQERLQIIRIKESDQGQYTCTISSSDGYTNSIVINLIVNKKSKQICFLLFISVHFFFNLL